ncbi:MAG: hypothetical protein ACK6CT_14100 [Planctomycetia bacterium]|jgi:hypothetical protein
MDQNPYLSPSASAAAPPATPKAHPASLTVFGILNIIFGILGICVTAGGVVPFVMELPSDPAVPNPMLDLIKSNAGYRTFLIVSLALGGIVAVTVIVGGIGLLLAKAWGRTLSIVYGWYSIVAAIVGMGVNFYLMQPLLAKMQDAGGPGQLAVTAGLVGGLIGAGLGMIYPVLLLVFMNRPAIRDAVGSSRGL